ncbi:MAG: hypothetical protein IPM35_08795 [Myxococcales bacterium]|nr:hypothetical protein [Myxococcales bacterium]
MVLHHGGRAAHLDELPLALAGGGVSLVAVSDARPLLRHGRGQPRRRSVGRSSGWAGRRSWRCSAPPRRSRATVVDALGFSLAGPRRAPLVGKNIALDVLEGCGARRASARSCDSCSSSGGRVPDLRAHRPRVWTPSTARSPRCGCQYTLPRAHAPAIRVGEQLNFMLPGRRSIMVATSARSGSPSGVVGVGEAALLDKGPADFGLCLEKKDLRFVLHWSARRSLGAVPCGKDRPRRAGRRRDTCVLFHDSSDRARHEASLAQARIQSRHLTHLAKALEPAAIDARRARWVAGARERPGRKLTETWRRSWTTRVWSTCRQGWLRVTGSAPALSAGAQRLAARLDRLRAQDGRRLGGVSAYAEVSGCRLAALARYFGGRWRRGVRALRGLPRQPAPGVRG